MDDPMNMPGVVRIVSGRGFHSAESEKELRRKNPDYVARGSDPSTWENVRYIRRINGSIYELTDTEWKRVKFVTEEMVLLLDEAEARAIQQSEGDESLPLTEEE
jgi:hypothetical protein